MTTTDPILKQLVADTTAAEESIPLDLYLPSGKVFGHTAPHKDFCGWATGQLGREPGYTGTVAPAPDVVHGHLITDPIRCGPPWTPRGVSLLFTRKAPATGTADLPSHK